MKWIAFALVITSIVAGTVPGQNHSNGYALVATSTSTPMAMGLYTRGSSVQTLVQSSVFTTITYLNRACMDVDNTGYVLTYWEVTQNAGILRVSSNGSILQSIVARQLAPFDGMPLDVMVDFNGDYTLLIGNGFQPPALLRLTRTGSVTTILQGTKTTFFRNPATLAWDVETGEYLVYDEGYFLQSQPPHIYRIAHDGSRAATIASMKIAMATNTPITRDSATGDIYYATLQGVFVLPQGGTVSTLLTGPFTQTLSLVADRASDPNPRLVGGVGGATPFLFSMDLATKAVTTITTQVPYVWEVFPHRHRNVTTIRQGPGIWDVLFDFPQDAGNAYAAALSISGTRPGFHIGNRRVAINPDTVMVMSLQGLLAPIYTGYTGVLSPFGTAKGRIDVSMLLPGIAGLKIWVQALTINPHAPLGVATIADPHLLIL